MNKEKRDPLSEITTQEANAACFLTTSKSENTDSYEKRSSDLYKPTYQRFKLKRDQTFARQYSHIYVKRALALKNIVLENMNAKLSNEGRESVKKVNRIIDLQEGENVICVGTIYKEMPLKLSILDDYTDEVDEESEVIKETKKAMSNYCSKEDYLILEDETGRVKLQSSGVLNVDEWSTGVVLAVEGMVKAGEFVVSNVVTAGVAPCATVYSSSKEMEVESDSNVLLISGLEVGGTTDPFPTQLLVEYITGLLGSKQEQAHVATFSRVILAGGGLNICVSNYEDTSVSANQQAIALEPLQTLDAFISQLCSSIPVDFMPGESDPTTASLPQKPINRAILPIASRYTTLNAVCNPYECEINGKTFLGTSGQPISNMKLYMKEDMSTLEVLEKTLEWRHLAPTAPDTLACYPYGSEDPFLLESSPHVYFAGNQDKFQTSLVETSSGESVRVICIPKFSTTGTAVVVNTNTLECYPLTFSFFGGSGDVDLSE